MEHELEKIKAELESERALRAEVEGKLKRLIDERERFASVAAHELKAPLNTISSYAQLLTLKYRDKFEQEPREWLVMIAKGVQRMSVLLDALLEYSFSEIEGKEDTWESFRPPV